jgi:hypothetical protein
MGGEVASPARVLVEARSTSLFSFSSKHEMHTSPISYMAQIRLLQALETHGVL